jgi:hypothetical protein
VETYTPDTKQLSREEYLLFLKNNSAEWNKKTMDEMYRAFFKRSKSASLTYYGFLEMAKHFDHFEIELRNFSIKEKITLAKSIKTPYYYSEGRNLIVFEKRIAFLLNLKQHI